jgi:hypothetical protein
MLLVAFAVGTTAAYGQASRTWVSGVGDDVNPCSRTAPCKTWAGAISKTAAGGEIDALDPGGFGALTIVKAITLDGGGGQVASTLAAGTNGIVVQAGAGDVVIIRNLRINGIRQSPSGGTNGIRFLSGKDLIIENCNIFGFTNNGIDIASAGGQVHVINTTSSNNGGSGIRSQSTSATSVTIESSGFYANVFGVWAGDFSNFSVNNSSSSGNSSHGFVAQPQVGGTATLNISNSTASNNSAVGVQAGGSAFTATINLVGDTLFNNGTGILAASNGTINSSHTNFNTGTGSPNGSFISPQ